MNYRTLNIDRILNNYLSKKASNKILDREDLSFCNYHLDYYEISFEDKDSIHLKFWFRKTIETESTNYPDNPPIESLYEQSLQLDFKGNIMHAGKPFLVSKEMDF